jgi:N6-adenosine-specific RNA methylase IME4
VKKYSVIYADPPWEFKSKKTGGSMKSGAAAKYPTMTLDQLKDLDIASLCADDCLLVMWHVGSQPIEAVELCKAWGFKFSTMSGFVWVKLTSAKKLPFFGMGTTRQGSESALIGFRGKMKNIIKCKSIRAVRSEPVGRHSEKPASFRLDIEKLCGDVPRLEMFARSAPAGWDVFGNEVEGSVFIPSKSEGRK